jgi:drug/metabolite transporter (DMT)-like permease
MTIPEAAPPSTAAKPAGYVGRFRTHLKGLEGNALGMAYVSAGTFMLVIMAAIAKYLGERLPSFELLFFRAAIGLLFVLPVLRGNFWEPFQTKRFGMHFFRGAVGAGGNLCFFWTLTHMLLADSMALQFSRPLWTIPMALVFLGEWAGVRRSLISIVGFVGIMLYARPFTSGFDANAIVGGLGGFFGALVVIGIKQLAKTENTRVIMFYYAVWNGVFALIPTIFVWVTPQMWELPLLVAVGFLGIAGQGLVTKGLSHGEATVLAPLDYSRIVYAAGIGYILFGEIPGFWSFAGMALIVITSIYLVLTEKKAAR